MGCDIHTHIEKNKGNGWVNCTRYTFEYSGTPQRSEVLEDRYYERFGYLAGVRGLSVPSVEVKGLPKDATKETLKDFEQWKDDAHNMSYLTLKEIKKIHRNIKKESKCLKQWIKYLKLIKEDYLEDDEIRVVFWFDN